MKHPNQSPANEELIRKALAPPGSTNESASNNTPARKASTNKTSVRKTVVKKTPAKKTPAKKTPAKKTPAKKTPAKKTPAKKTPASKPPAQDSEVFTSKIIEWDKEKGFGFLRHQKSKLFLHRNDFAERHKRPGKGDKVHYQISTDSKGRRCAVAARHVNDGGKTTTFTWIKLLLLVAMPLLAWSHLMVTQKLPLLLFFIPLAAINLWTYFTYKNDKKSAQKKEWRTSEATLHFLELIGGWPAAFIAQRQFRHKCAKPDFAAVYGMIVLLHLFLAFDYIIDWKVTTTILDSFVK